MASAVFTNDIAQIFAYAGWRQFLLDDQFKLSPPCTHLAELCGVAPSLLENTPLLNLFDPSDQKKLRSLLAQLAVGSQSNHPFIGVDAANNQPSYQAR